jgi:hypothetical protein
MYHARAGSEKKNTFCAFERPTTLEILFEPDTTLAMISRTPEAIFVHWTTLRNDIH